MKKENRSRTCRAACKVAFRLRIVSERYFKAYPERSLRVL